MEDEYLHESTAETSHPDIDSALDMHLGSGDFSYRTREVDGSTEHVIKKMKKGTWKDHLTIEGKKVDGFDNEELATYLIHQVSMNQAFKRRIIGIMILFLFVAMPIVLYSVLVLGLTPEDDFEVYLIGGGVTVIFIPILCIMLSSAERSADKRLYSIRPNFIEVLQKMKEHSEEDYQKQALENRIRRLVDRSQTRFTE
ncbi:MAG: hypothetical protein ACW98U_14355 [Candidatus Thorarchaeota archaeon]